MKILFQGDSITDAGRDRRNYHDLGYGYPKYAAKYIAEAHAGTEFEFINFGISANRTCQLCDRLYWDAIMFQPDIISVLIGINDIWHRYGNERINTSLEQTVANYRSILNSLKTETTAKIVMLSPYILDKEPCEHMRDDLNKMLPHIRELAKEYADVYIPLDEHFENALKSQPTPCYYSNDGVHPNDNGAEFIGRLYAEAVEKLI